MAESESDIRIQQTPHTLPSRLLCLLWGFGRRYNATTLYCDRVNWLASCKRNCDVTFLHIFVIIFNSNLFPGIQLIINPDWFRLWPGTEEMTNHYLKQWWLLYWRMYVLLASTLKWRHNGRDSVSNHQPHDYLLNRLFRRRSKKTSKLRVTGLSAGNSPGTGEFPAQIASYAENISIWWRHHVS